MNVECLIQGTLCSGICHPYPLNVVQPDFIPWARLSLTKKTKTKKNSSKFLVSSRRTGNKTSQDVQVGEHDHGCIEKTSKSYLHLNGSLIPYDKRIR